MKKLLLTILLVLTGTGLTAQVKPKPWAAAAYTIGIDAFTWAYDRYVTGSEFAKISFSTMKHNLRTGFVWDSDRLATNHLGHPFNGGMYHVTSRLSGLNFWQALPYSTGGSLLWELFAEKEPPGLNDLIATPLAGAALGEVFYRSLTRFLPGNTASRDRFPLSLSVTLGDRYMSDGADITAGGHYPVLRLAMEYGEPFDCTENRPFDYFYGHTTLHIGSSDTQPLFNDVSITGRIWGHELQTGSDATEAVFGIWQQYDFYHQRSAKKGEDNPLFNFSETVAAGPGFMFRQQGEKGTFRQALFADIIGLGAVENANLFIIERHYNMGSGFALKSLSSIRLWDKVSLSFQARLFYLNTWGDYTTRGQDIDPLYTDTMGDKGHSWAFILSPAIQVDVTRHWGLSLSASRYGRDSFYKSFPTAKSRTTELLTGVCYNF